MGDMSNFGQDNPFDQGKLKFDDAASLIFMAAIIVFISVGISIHLFKKLYNKICENSNIEKM